MAMILPSLVLLFGLPLLLVILFKANAGALFLAACAGIVLLSSLDPVVVTTASSVIPTEGEAYVRLLVVLVAVIIAGMIFKNTVHGTMLFVHVFLALICGMLLWLTLPMYSGLSWLVDVSDNETWLMFKDYQALFVAIGILLSLLAVHKKSHHGGGHGHIGHKKH